MLSLSATCYLFWFPMRWPDDLPNVDNKQVRIEIWIEAVSLWMAMSELVVVSACCWWEWYHIWSSCLSLSALVQLKLLTTAVSTSCVLGWKWIGMVWPMWVISIVLGQILNCLSGSCTVSIGIEQGRDPWYPLQGYCKANWSWVCEVLWVYWGLRQVKVVLLYRRGKTRHQVRTIGLEELCSLPV